MTGARHPKVLPRRQFFERAREERLRGKRIIFTNGCFDLLHAGHIRSLQAARDLGDCLYVGVNADSSPFFASKGPARPIVPGAERAELLAALEVVDAVTLFEEETPLQLILGVQPDVIVKGGDWAPEQVVGHAEAAAWGGTVHVLPRIPGLSTTGIEERILLAHGHRPAGDE